ncbi:bifunctional GNAT family N-acetyltransferase/hotdog fold thioesterase [Aliidiomarina maris]|uniref:GNAT family N-acetyltransferase n=1 Tax=Aliidiomarina maris TaxID=531312 RepID=A0A327WU29_9GAMM|nr:bifunctional GNAT family N-acetyltransferase/hotdog fold thioesterase [Aliidiomarina maris]RAJ96362.1 thioesterase domain-containing protein [Aliidiomarina maris]RUO22859.1 GNAT family N-acetyltransferase [Aliidiomarina maris]
MQYTIIQPSTEQQLNDYFQLRWEVLRKPFKRPRGSEQDEYDQVSEHCMLVDADQQAIGIGRLHFNSPEEAQIRFMAVKPDLQGEGHGVRIIQFLELKARDQGATRVIINSRDTTLGFYLKCGYELKEEADTVNNPMAEHQLVKYIDASNHIIYRPRWCHELQQTWQQQIPISDAMGIRIYQYTGRSLETRANLARNVNVHDTMFAGSIYSLATLTGWGMVQLQLQEKELDGAVVLAEGSIKYLKPLASEPRAVVYLEDLHGNMQVLRKHKNAHLNVDVTVYDEDTPVAYFNGRYVVKAQRP